MEMEEESKRSDGLIAKEKKKAKSCFFLLHLQVLLVYSMLRDGEGSIVILTTMKLYGGEKFFGQVVEP